MIQPGIKPGTERFLILHSSSVLSEHQLVNHLENIFLRNWENLTFLQIQSWKIKQCQMHAEKQCMNFQSEKFSIYFLHFAPFETFTSMSMDFKALTIFKNVSNQCKANVDIDNVRSRYIQFSTSFQKNEFSILQGNFSIS